ncbi:MAG: prolipoprotein diacylglyceryl transferase [Stomatobaculum sp.]
MNSLGFYVGGVFIAYYGLWIVAGITAAFFLALYQIKRYRLDINDFIIICATGGFFAFTGAKLFYLLIHTDRIDFGRLRDAAHVSSLLQGGFVFYGGLLLGLPAAYIAAELFKIQISEYIKYCIPVVPFAHAFGRLGCMTVGCCYGCIFRNPLAITYRGSVLAPNNIPLFPVQLTEAVLLFAISIALLIYINHYKGEQALYIYLLTYAAVRFILEFFRYDNAERGIYFKLSSAQYVSIFFLMFASIHLYRIHRSQCAPGE